MSGFTNALYLKSPNVPVPYLLRINENGSINTELSPLTGNIKASNIIVSENIAVKIPMTPLENRKTMILFPSVPVFLGESSVTPLDGFPVAALYYMAMDLADNIDLYAIAEVSGEVRILEIA